jgi:hypothetical protein
METGAAPEPERRRARPGPPLRKLSEELAFLRTQTAERTVTLREVLVTLRGRGYSLLLILLALPFATPIPLPGLSTPFGLAIALIALRLALGQRPWLPKRLQRKTLPPGFFGRLLGFSTGLVRLLEKVMRPRLAPVTEAAFLRQAHALLMFFAALGLLLPLPIPFTNSFPAWVILLMAGGLLERDGLAVLGAYVVFAAGIAYFLLLGEAARQLIEALRQWLAH